MILVSFSLSVQGFAKHHNDQCYTVFSAPRYCGLCTNKGAVLQFAQPDSTEPQIVQFEGHHYSPAELMFKKKKNLHEDDDTELKIALDLSMHFMESAEDAELERVIEQSMWEAAPACQTAEVYWGEEAKSDEYNEENDPELQTALAMSRLQT